MQLRILTTITLAMMFMTSNAQNFSDKLFKTYGSQFEINVMPTFLTGDDDAPISQFVGGSFLSPYFGFRYNVYEGGDNQSVGIGIVPSVGIISGGSFTNLSEVPGFSSFTMPVEVSLNLGAGSTYNSSKNFGFFVKTGIEWNAVPLVVIRDGYEGEIKKSYFLPHVSLGLRYFGKRSNALKQFYIRYSFAKNEDLLPTSADINSPYSIKIGFGKVIGY